MTSDSDSLEQKLDEIKTNQQTLLNLSKKHLQLYASQIDKTDELNRLFVELQKQSQKYQRTAIIFTLVTVFAVAAYVVLMAR